MTEASHQGGADRPRAAVAVRMPPRRPLPAAPRPPLPTTPEGPATRARRVALAAGTLGLAGLLVWAMAAALLPGGFGPAVAGIMALHGLAVLGPALAATTALIGLAAPPGRPATAPSGWRPQGRTAILILTCGEPPLPILRHVRTLRRDLAAAGLGGGAAGLFLLSDSRGPAAVAEARAFAGLGGVPGVWWRQRASNRGRKPGNIADWLAGWGGGWDYMLVLDADSRMSAARIARMVRRIEARPDIGLVQAGMRLVPARTRFGALQRLSARLGGPVFGRGLAAWAGRAGNYWGHNALMRTDAFAAVAELPELSGRAPWGGAVLSHDFVEAALLRRAGWAVEIDPDSRGSFEDAPQRLGEFHRRDRRWCQGNLQHLRLIATPGLHPASRLHLAAGILGYLVAPVWLALVIALALSGAAPAAVAPLAGGLALLAVPKLAGAAAWCLRARTGRRRRVVLRAAAGELLLSSLLATAMLLRQSLAVAAVAAGRDCGWRPAGAEGPARTGTARTGTALAGKGRGEAAAGLALGLVVAVWSGPVALALLAPVLLPLLLMPFLARWLERPLRRGAAPRRLARPSVPGTAAATAPGRAAA